MIKINKTHFYLFLFKKKILETIHFEFFFISNGIIFLCFWKHQFFNNLWLSSAIRKKMGRPSTDMTPLNKNQWFVGFFFFEDNSLSGDENPSMYVSKVFKVITPLFRLVKVFQISQSSKHKINTEVHIYCTLLLFWNVSDIMWRELKYLLSTSF